jgi:putative copper export protein
MHHLLLVIHLLAATIWVGGHCILCFRYLPLALQQKNPGIISGFEKRYEIIGLPSLVLLVITGIAMAYRYGIFINTWFSFSHPIEKVVSFKLLLLLVTVLLALHARLFIIPRLRVATLWLLAVHIILVTVIGITMLVLGSFVRFGGL